MNLVDLKHKKIKELVSLAASLDIEGYSNMTRQELIFAILKEQVKMESCGEVAFLKYCRMVLVFFVRLITTTCQGLMIFMSRRHRSAALTCALAIRWKARFVRQKIMNGILLS